jgi:hypothetical protein
MASLLDIVFAFLIDNGEINAEINETRISELLEGVTCESLRKSVVSLGVDTASLMLQEAIETLGSDEVELELQDIIDYFGNTQNKKAARSDDVLAALLFYCFDTGNTMILTCLLETCEDLWIPLTDES